MAAFKDYAAIAIAAYSKSVKPYPFGHMVKGYSCKIWETGTWFGNGFQGGVYENDREIIIGFCGTNPGSSSFGQDLYADVKLALGNSSLEGRIALTLADPRPHARVDLTSDLLDLRNLKPPASTAVLRFSNTRRVCARKSPAPTVVPVWSSGTCPAMWSVRARATDTTCE